MRAGTGRHHDCLYAQGVAVGQRDFKPIFVEALEANGCLLKVKHKVGPDVASQLVNQVGPSDSLNRWLAPKGKRLTHLTSQHRSDQRYLNLSAQSVGRCC